MMITARPSKNLGSLDVGSLVKRTRTLPVTSTPLKSSHLYSGAVMPWPTKMASPSKRVLGCCVWLTPTKSSSHLNSSSLPHTEALRVASGWVSMPTSGTFWKYVPLSPAGLALARANCVALYSVATPPPRAPTPRPPSKSSDRKRSCSRMRSAEMEPSWASPPEAAMSKIATGLSMIQGTLAGPAAANFRNFPGSETMTKVSSGTPNFSRLYYQAGIDEVGGDLDRYFGSPDSETTASAVPAARKQPPGRLKVDPNAKRVPSPRSGAGKWDRPPGLSGFFPQPATDRASPRWLRHRPDARARRLS